MPARVVARARVQKSPREASRACLSVVACAGMQLVGPEMQSTDLHMALHHLILSVLHLALEASTTPTALHKALHGHPARCDDLNGSPGAMVQQRVTIPGARLREMIPRGTQVPPPRIVGHYSS